MINSQTIKDVIPVQSKCIPVVYIQKFTVATFGFKEDFKVFQNIWEASLIGCVDGGGERKKQMSLFKVPLLNSFSAMQNILYIYNLYLRK
jgi:hypothetical protein